MTTAIILAALLALFYRFVLRPKIMEPVPSWQLRNKRTWWELALSDVLCTGWITFMVTRMAL